MKPHQYKLIWFIVLLVIVASITLRLPMSNDDKTKEAMPISFADLRFQTPPNWEAFPFSFGSGAIFYDVNNLPTDADAGSRIAMAAVYIEPNPTGFLPDFLATFEDGVYVYDYRIGRLDVDGRIGLLAYPERAEDEPDIVAFIPGSDYVVVVMSGGASETEFLTFVNSFDLP